MVDNTDLPDDVPDGYSEGTVEDATVDNRDTEEVVIVDDEKECYYVFEMRELSFSEVTELVGDNMQVIDGEIGLDSTGYTVDALEAKIVDSNVDQLRTFLTGMRQGIGRKLDRHVPDPLDTDELEEELGNLEQQ